LPSRSICSGLLLCRCPIRFSAAHPRRLLRLARSGDSHGRCSCSSSGSMASALLSGSPGLSNTGQGYAVVVRRGDGWRRVDVRLERLAHSPVGGGTWGARRPSIPPWAKLAMTCSALRSCTTPHSHSAWTLVTYPTPPVPGAQAAPSSFPSPTASQNQAGPSPDTGEAAAPARPPSRGESPSGNKA
jgi:hypothetical protein